MIRAPVPLRALGPAIGLALVVVLFLAIPPHPSVTLLDVRTVAVQTVIVGTAAVGATLVIIAGGIDLSVGSVVALTSVCAALGVGSGCPPVFAPLVAIAAGAACGLYNGALITSLRLPPFIATLGTLGLFRGVGKWVSGARPISAEVGVLGEFVRPTPGKEWFVLAPGVWVMALIGAAAAAGLRRTVFGTRVRAVGSNETAARHSGVPVARVKLGVYAGAGALAGLAGVFQFARLTQGDPTVAVGLELDVIAAVVIGGASLSGGQGSIFGTLCGAILMSYLRNRCTAMGWPNFVQEMIVGHIIIGAVAIDQWGRWRAA